MSELTQEVLTELRAIAATSTEIQARLAGNVINDILEAGTALIGADGTWFTDWRVSAGALWIYNLGTHTMTLVAGSPSAAGAPTTGKGVFSAPAGKQFTVPFLARAMTVYGTAGDQFNYAVFTAPARPATGAG
jgi:hypothetical protein